MLSISAFTRAGTRTLVYTHTRTHYPVVQVELFPGGSSRCVTWLDRAEYVTLALAHKLKEGREQVCARACVCVCGGGRVIGRCDTSPSLIRLSYARC